MKGFGQVFGGRRTNRGERLSADEVLAQYVEVVKGELWWTDAPGAKQDTDSIRYFSIEEDLVYKPIFQDFGPVNLGMIHRYCTIVSEKLRAAEMNDQKLVHYCSDDPAKRTNAILLASAFQVVVNGTTAREAWQPFENLLPAPRGFVDALDPPSEFELSIMDCLRGLQRAVDLEWFDFKMWGPKTYEWLGRYTHGDMTWIVPKKLLAFPEPTLDEETKHGFLPENYAPLFHSMGVSLVVRLTKNSYDAQRFENLGISHEDYEFEDGSCPMTDHIEKFMNIVEKEEGGVAVHCTAGLGRTCTLIGLYCMKHFGFSALGFIGWCRLARPGSILGPQQQFLVAMEKRMHDLGSSSGSKFNRTASVSGPIPLSPKSSMSLRSSSKQLSLRSRMPNMIMQDEALREVLGRSQGQKLRDAKRRTSGDPKQLTDKADLLSKQGAASSCMGCFTGLWSKFSRAKAPDEAKAEQVPTSKADATLPTAESRQGSKTVSFFPEGLPKPEEKDATEAAEKKAAEEEAAAKAAAEAAAQAAAVEKAAAEAAAKKAAEEKAAAEAAEAAKKKAAEEEAAAKAAAETAAKAAAEEKAAAEAATKKAAEEAAAAKAAAEAAEAAEAAQKKAAEEEAAAAKAAAEAAAQAAAEEKAAAEAAAKKAAEEKEAAKAAEAAKKKAAEEEAAAKAAAEAAAKVAAEEKAAAEAAAKKAAEEKAAVEAAEAAKKKAAEEEAAAAKAAAKATAKELEAQAKKAAAQKGGRGGKVQKKAESPGSVAGA